MSTSGLTVTRSRHRRRGRVDQWHRPAPGNAGEDVPSQHGQQAEAAGEQQRAAAVVAPVPPSGAAVLAGQPMQNRKPISAPWNSATAQPGLAASQQAGEQEQGAGGERGLERHPQPERRPVGQVSHHPDGHAAAGDEPRLPRAGATTSWKSARPREVRGASRPRVTRGDAEAWWWTSRTPRWRPDRRHGHDQGRQRERDAPAPQHRRR